LPSALFASRYLGFARYWLRVIWAMPVICFALFGVAVISFALFGIAVIGFAVISASHVISIQRYLFRFISK